MPTIHVQKLTPVMSMLVEGGEAGMVSQDISVELDPIPGRLLTPITAQIFAVFVPLEAIDTIVDPLAAYAGMTEVVREKLITGNVLFTLEDENEISQRCAAFDREV